MAAALAWSLDNILTRPLADADPVQVVRWNAIFGVAASAGLALLTGAASPPAIAIVGLLVCGATGYGLSLRLYLSAQRAIGAARTASIFAAGPFAGVLLAIAMGEHAALAWVGGAAILFAVGVYLHVAERHDHDHRHEPQEHEHLHRHDDDHHGHRHDPPFVGEHSHAHRHEALVHAHPHGPDLHHRHH